MNPATMTNGTRTNRATPVVPQFAASAARAGAVAITPTVMKITAAITIPITFPLKEDFLSPNCKDLRARIHRGVYISKHYYSNPYILGIGNVHTNTWGVSLWVMERTQTDWESVVNRVQSIIDEYAGMRLTLRQIYYRLVAAQRIRNVLSQYKGLSRVLVAARWDGRIDPSDIEDRTRGRHEAYGVDRSALRHFRLYWDYVKNMDNSYTMPRWWGQDRYVEVWLEKEALASLFSQVTDEEGIDLMPCRGYPSFTFLHEAARHLEDLSERQITILYFGDFDPSGQDIERYVEETLSDMGIPDIDFQRIAITRNQIDEYEIPPAPAKTTDSRLEGFVARHGVAWQVELDAIEPRRLQTIIREAILPHWDPLAGERREEELGRRRGHIRGWLDEALNEDFDPPQEDPSTS